MTQTPSSPQEQILGIVNNYWQGCCVGAAAQLELADLLADGPQHVDTLAERSGTHSASLHRMLRALESTGIFKQVSPRVFANTPASECLRRHAPNTQWAWIRLALSEDGTVFEGWRGLMSALKTGRSGYEQLLGQPAWKTLQENPQKGTIFNQAMRDLSATMTPAITAAYNWTQFPVIADVGGGIGTQITDILNVHPSSRGVLFDLPYAIEQAPPHNRIDRVVGDFFEKIPVEADAYLLRWIIHDWDDEKSLIILKNVRAAAKPEARLMVVDSVIPETDDFDMGKWMDLNMLVMIAGQERTATEFRGLFGRAGFDLEEIIPTASPLSIVVGKPRP